MVRNCSAKYREATLSFTGINSITLAENWGAYSSSLPLTCNKTSKEKSLTPFKKTGSCIGAVEVSPTIFSWYLSNFLKLMAPPVGVGPTWGWTHVSIVGWAWPDPLGKGMATNHSPTDPFPSPLYSSSYEYFWTVIRLVPHTGPICLGLF